VPHLGFEVASEEHLDNKAARYFKARRVAPAFVERAHPAPILRGSLPATAVGRAGAGVERRLAWFAAKVVVAEQDHTATKTPSEFTQPAGAERQHRIDR